MEEVVRRASGWGTRTAVVDERRAVSYEELCERGAGLAAGLRRKGVGEGSTVAILTRNCVEVFETQLAVALAGAVAVPLNHRLTAHELDALAGTLAPAAVLGERELIAPLAGTVPPGRAWVMGGPEYEALANGAPLELERHDPDGAGLMMLTSGTTSRPRCAVSSRRAVRSCAVSWLASARPADEAVYFSCTPHFHSTLPIALAHRGIGATVAVVRDFSPQRALETIERLRVTHAYLVPSMLSLMLRVRGVASLATGSLREIYHGGAPLDPGLGTAAATAFEAELRDCYGQAQGGGPITLAAPRGAASPSRPHTVGPPLLGVELRIAAADGDRLADGSVGEVWVRGGQLMSGYHGDPAASAEAIVDGWLRTGDLGCLDERGELRLVDRLADLIIRGGQNVYSAEVEQVIGGLEGVEEVAVVGVADEHWGEVPVAFAVASPGHELSEAALAGRCRERLAPYKCPRDFLFVEELPRNAAGKVRKRDLRDRPGAAAR